MSCVTFHLDRFDSDVLEVMQKLSSHAVILVTNLPGGSAAI
jgi:hypothetical protein